MPTFYGYCRASTSGQAYTFEAQQKVIRATYDARFSETHEWGGFFEDKATSGGKPFTERPEGLKLWVLAQKGDVVCWSKMDRAFRNLFDMTHLIQMFDAKGIGFLSLDVALDTATPLGKFVMHLLGSVAELERHWISQRTKEAMAIRAEKGLPAGNRPPVGWKKNSAGQWDWDHTERKIIEWAIVQHDQHGKTWKGIAEYLRKKGIRRANGDQYWQCWFHYALKARAAGYPGRDGFRELTARGGSIKMGKATKTPRKYTRRQGDPQSQTEACPESSEASSSQSDNHAPTPCQTPESSPPCSDHQTQTAPPNPSQSQSA
jgi:DNA invertase Pin-like site-specific DNA recombinase